MRSGSVSSSSSYLISYKQCNVAGQIWWAEGARICCHQRFPWIKVTCVTCMGTTDWITETSNATGNQQNAFTNDCHCIWKAKITTTEVLKSAELQCNERVNEGLCIPPKTPQIYILFEFPVLHYHVQKILFHRIIE